MKVTVIHNTYRFNPYIRESVALNLQALQESKTDYQYIVFNDNGDTKIEKEILDLDVEYHYSEYNFGKKMCSGGWIGALPLVKGDIVHNVGQDDVFTSMFYKNSLESLSKDTCDLVYSNGFKTREDLTITGDLLGPLENYWNYEDPRSVFRDWMGFENGKITRSNNYIPAPGTMYKIKLHQEIGEPDVENFRGICDFEYWVRVLFFKKRIKYLPFPTWLYRLSSYTTSKEVIDGKLNERDIVHEYHQKLREKYQKMIENE